MICTQIAYAAATPIGPQGSPNAKAIVITGMLTNPQRNILSVCPSEVKTQPHVFAMGWPTAAMASIMKIREAPSH